jgi:two-component system, cell cycle sensor histidine kinase and response regulator CckA
MNSLMSIDNGTILLVEDDFAISEFVQVTLKRLGYRVLTAYSIVNTWEVWKQHRNEIRLLLTNLVMPGGISGQELAAILIKEKPELKVIYTTGNSGEMTQEELQLQTGVNFLPKPYSPHELFETLRKNLD